MVVLTLSVLPWPHRTSEYVQLSVGNADAAVLWDRDAVFAIDTGEDGLTLATYLRQRRLSLDGLILTHLHADHAGGVRALLDEHIPVDVCYLACGAEEAAVQPEMTALVAELEKAGTKIIHLSRCDELSLPGGSMTVLWPEAGRTHAGKDANQYSLALLAQVNDVTLLLTGDLDGAYENYSAVPADVLKVAHHGSASSTSAAFLQAVSPQTLLLSCGSEARAAAMAQRGEDIPLVDTYTHGAIVVHLDHGGYTIETMR